jgi:hypothetical protein
MDLDATVDDDRTLPGRSQPKERDSSSMGLDFDLGDIGAPGAAEPQRSPLPQPDVALDLLRRRLIGRIHRQNALLLSLRDELRDKRGILADGIHGVRRPIQRLLAPRLGRRNLARLALLHQAILEVRRVLLVNGRATLRQRVALLHVDDLGNVAANRRDALSDKLINRH